MITTALRTEHIEDVRELMTLGEPFVHPRGLSDYWLYATLFSSTCPVTVDNGALTGAVIAFRSQDNPDDVYIQDVMTHPDHRHQGIARTLLGGVRAQAQTWGCRRLYLTSEPDNASAHATWTALGFTNIAGDEKIDGISVITDFKGPGRTRAVYELVLARPGSGAPPR